MAVLAAALLAGGCATSVAGEASPAPVESTGPLAQVLAEADLDDAVPGLADTSPEVTSDGAGGVYAVLEVGDGDQPLVVLALPAADGGFAEPAVTEAPQVQYVDTLHATRDGRVLVVGQVDPEDSQQTMFGLLVLDAATGTGPAHDLLPESGEYRDDVATALSPDQQTLVALVLVDVGDDQDLRLVTVDVGSGEIRGSRTLDDELTERSLGQGVTVAEDGTITVAAEIYENSDDEYPRTVLARYGADLEPRGEPITVSEAADELEFEGLASAADGTVVAALDGFGEARVVRLAPDAEAPAVVVETEESISGLVVEPAGTWAHVLDGDLLPVSLNLETGEFTDPLELCAGTTTESNGLLPGDGDGAVLVHGYCSAGDSDEEPAERVWKLGPAA